MINEKETITVENSINKKLNTFMVNDLKDKKKDIEFIFGCMKSGKSTALISEGNKAKEAKKHVMCFKLDIDNRGEGLNILKSRNGAKIEAIVCKKTDDGGEVLDMLEHINKSKKKPHLILIDEIQFWHKKTIKVLDILAKSNIKVKAGGLDMYATGKMWETSKEMFKIATKKTHKFAYCETENCGRNATHTSFVSNIKIKNKNGINIGDEGMYIANCKKCWTKNINKAKNQKTK